MNTTKAEKISKVDLLDKCWTYLNDNFHKFTETNKIRIALELTKKDMPTQLAGSVAGGDTRIIILNGKSADNTSRIPEEIHL